MKMVVVMVMEMVVVMEIEMEMATCDNDVRFNVRSPESIPSEA